MILPRWVSLAVTALFAFDVVCQVVSESDRDLQYGKGKGKGGGSGGCQGPLEEFESEVIVDFDGFDEDPRDITRINWDGLEYTFRETYNTLSADLCDDLFRRIIDVKIQVNKDDEVLTKTGGASYSLRYRVTAVCQGCNPNTVTLFSPPEGGLVRNLIASDGRSVEQTPLDAVLQRRRRNKSSKDSKDSKDSKSKNSKKSAKGGGGEGGGGSDVSCECYSSHPEYRAPTEEEFRTSYDAAIKVYRQPGSYRRGGVAVDSVLKVTEVEDVSCSAVVEEFMALVSVEFFGDREAVTDEERAVLEENFVLAYNGLQANRCDSPLFRTATLAKIVLVSDPAEPPAFMYVFAVTGTCRGQGCSDGITLFQMDELMRMLARDPGYIPDTECRCPVFGNKFGPPSTSEFEVRYFQVVQDLREIGKITNIDASGQVMELPADVTAIPTNSPTPIASPSGTLRPTRPGETFAPSNPAVSLPPTRPGETFAPSANPSSPNSPSITLPPFTFPPTRPGETFSPSGAPSTGAMLVSGGPSLSLAPSAQGTVFTTEPSVAPSLGTGATPSTAPSASEAPSLAAPVSGQTEAPSTSVAPTSQGGSELPSASPAPSVSEVPTAASPVSGQTEAPSTSVAPTSQGGSELPSASPAPSASGVPTAANPVSGQTEAPSTSASPTSQGGSELPSASPAPSASGVPTAANPVSGQTEAPSTSRVPTSSSASPAPSSSQIPTRPVSGQTTGPSVSDSPNASEKPSLSLSPGV